MAVMHNNEASPTVSLIPGGLANQCKKAGNSDRGKNFSWAKEFIP